MQHISPIFNEPCEVESLTFERDGWQLVRCIKTGLVFLPNPPPYNALEKSLAWEQSTLVERERRRQSEPLFAQVSALTKAVRRNVLPHRNKMSEIAWSAVGKESRVQPVRILDIGCGTGNLMVDLVNRFTRLGGAVVPIGIEVSEALSKKSNARFRSLGGEVIFANALDGTVRSDIGTINLIIMNSFLEHEAKPRVLLENLAPVLASDGAIAIKVPNFASWNRVIRRAKWCGFRYPDHVNYFSPRTLKLLAEVSGYRMEPQHITERLPFSDNMYAVLRIK